MRRKDPDRLGNFLIRPPILKSNVELYFLQAMTATGKRKVPVNKRA